MTNSSTLLHPFSVPKVPHVSSSKTDSSLRLRCTGISCSYGKMGKKAIKEDYYKLLGISVDATSQEIKEAYRKLQKKHHPDIAGQRGHEHTLKLNEAYQVLMRVDLRRNYDVSTGKRTEGFGSSFSGSGYSSWNGPIRSQGLFVDEAACIGCQECVHHASKTFMMDESLGCARVRVQFGDDVKQIEVSVDSCPVNCIHWVEAEELPLLEFLIRPQPKQGYGVFGGGWERPSNVFMAAKAFNKQSKQEEHYHGEAPAAEETPAQAKARAHASFKLQMERFSRIWTWLREVTGYTR
ncbi:DNAJ heat shock N-terminal domain-containing protein [Cinnamomum micranthum f. kanehirae]|uniref:DNAJ heat shock N-terminal domain-containing protein n=1 Tax=Cinnamomum micranthum f. kanehirae TaxID=337451 RepID=A0A3S3MK35_9MAGN|nr:DNAJ heat shock N-terminal domain-containing protein [Cinnamomum micranthum f. kanehirae]